MRRKAPKPPPQTLPDALALALEQLDALAAGEKDGPKKEGVRQSIEILRRAVVAYALANREPAPVVQRQVSQQPTQEAPGATFSAPGPMVAQPPPAGVEQAGTPGHAPPAGVPTRQSQGIPMPWKLAISQGREAVIALVEQLRQSGHEADAERLVEVAIATLPPKIEDPDDLPEGAGFRSASAPGT